MVWALLFEKIVDLRDGNQKMPKHANGFKKSSMNQASHRRLTDAESERSFSDGETALGWLSGKLVAFHANS